MLNRMPVSGMHRLLFAAAFAAFASASGVAAEDASGRGDLRPGAQPEFEKQHPAYLGWRLFQQKCADCHGADASGSERAPDLRQRVAEMSESRFVGTVLHRYVWIMPSGEARSESSARERLIEQILQGKKGNLAMPAWNREPAVSANIGDLYIYLRGRADGVLGAGRPAP